MSLLKRYTRLFYEEDKDFLILYHGTNSKNINNIKHQGLHAANGSLYVPGWFMLSTTKPSAIYHAGCDPDLNILPFLLTIKIPKTDDLKYLKRDWEGYPYLWKKEKVGKKNTYWYALRQPIPKEFIIKIEKIPISTWYKIHNDDSSSW